MLQINHLKKSFGNLTAVDDVSLSLSAGETLGLLGPNGAGKTTTIHMITGAITPDDGRIEVNGNPDPTSPEVRTTIGVAPQAISLYDNLNASENLAFFGKLYGLQGADLREAVDRCLAFAKLEDRKNDRVRTFSGGMQRRLNLACALVHHPKLIVLDEPTVGVDPQSRNHIFESIEALQAEGCSVIYTTHYMEEAQRLCDRIAIMDQGRILALDTFSALVKAHGKASRVHAVLEEQPSGTISLPGELDGTELSFESRTPFDDVAQLVSSGVQFQTLEVKQPDLEAVFLALTGRTLRDE